MKEKKKEMEEEEDNNDNDYDGELKNEINTYTRNTKRITSGNNNFNKKINKSKGSALSKEFLRYKSKFNTLEEGIKNNEYRFVLKLSKFEEYLFGDYSIGNYECIRSYIRQYMKIPLVLIKMPKYEIKPRISTFPPIIMMEGNQKYTYFNLLDKYLNNYPDKSAIFRFGLTEKEKENEDREEKLTKYCESGECDCPFELTIVGIYNLKLMFEWLNDSTYNKNEMMLGYFNDFQTKEEYESSLFKNKVQKFFGCKKNEGKQPNSHPQYHRSGPINPNKFGNDNNEDSKKKNKDEKKSQEQDKKKEQKEKKNTINLIKRSTRYEIDLQNKLNFLRLGKQGAESPNIIYKYIFNSSNYPEDTEKKINRLQTTPFYPLPNQKDPSHKHIKFPPTFVMIKIELLYGSYDIESYYSKNYIINDNIDIMEKIIFNPDKLIISHLPRETRLGITAFLLNKECSSKTEIG
jgi:hypothetical protein